MGLRARVLAWLSALLLLVCWGLALPLAFLCLNFNRTQGHWLWLQGVIQTPLLLGVLVLLPVAIWLRPVLNYLRSGRGVRQAQDRAELLPLRVIRPILLATLLDSLLAAVHLRLGVDFPLDEVIKRALLGIPCGLLSGQLAYFALSWLMRPVLELCEKHAPAPPRRKPRVGLFWKTWACLGVAGLIPLTLMGLMSSTFSQRQLERSLIDLNLGRLDAFARRISGGGAWNLPDLFQGHETVGLVGQRGRVQVVKGNEDEALTLVHESRVGRAGSRVLRQGESRILVWQPLNAETRLVALVSVSDYAPLLRQSLRGNLFAAGVTLVVGVALSFVLASHLSYPVAQLNRLARLVAPSPRGRPQDSPNWFSDDELGQLGRAFRETLLELRLAQDKLALVNARLVDEVEERSLEAEGLGTLVSLSDSLQSQQQLEPILERLAEEVREILSADGCSVWLLERERLVLRASCGLPASRHPRWPQDIRHSPRICREDGEPFPEILREEGIRTLLALPLRLQETVLGQLHVLHRCQRDYTFHQLELLEKVAAQAVVAIENARLYDERDRTAQLMLRALIPQGLDHQGLAVGHRYLPFKLLSGDYYDLIALGPQRFALVMADVAGKGPDAAIQAVRAKHVMRSSAVAGYSPARILRLLNRLIDEDSEGRMVTVFCAELDLKRSSLTYCNAGHEPPLFWSARAGQWQRLETTGVVLGASPQLECHEHRISFESGDLLLLFTDGVSEARDDQGEFITEERLLSIAHRYLSLSPQSLVDAIFEEVHSFTAGNFHDDFSILALRRADPESTST